MIDSPTLDEWEKEANTNITRGYYSESVTITSFAWSENNDKILRLIEELRKLQQREAAFREALALIAMPTDCGRIACMGRVNTAREVLARYPEEAE
jgi:inosine/xanthosine triphosphate pyrophosphatase family protein